MKIPKPEERKPHRVEIGGGAVEGEGAEKPEKVEVGGAA